MCSLDCIEQIKALGTRPQRTTHRHRHAHSPTKTQRGRALLHPQPPPGADAALPDAALPDAALPDAAPAAPPGAAPSGAAPSDATPLDAAPDPPAADPSATISARAGVFSACTEDWAKSYELVDGGFLACRRCKRAADRAGSSHVAVRITLSHSNWKNYAMDHCEKCAAPGLDAPPGQRQRRMGEFAGTRPRQN